MRTKFILAGNHESRDPQREGGQNALVAVPSTLPSWPYVHLLVTGILKILKNVNKCFSYSQRS